MEEWRDIPGYDGDYKVSDIGRVMSVGRVIRRRLKGSVKLYDKIMKQRTGSNGYCYISLIKNGKYKYCLVHRLVLLAFVGLSKGNVTCHNDGVRTNNNLLNLRYGTSSENQSDRIRHGTDSRGEKQVNHKLKEKEVLLIKKILKAKVIKQKQIAKMFKISKATITAINTKRIWAWL